MTGEAEAELTLTEHLIELRQRLLKAALFVAVVLVALLPVARNLYELLAIPMLRALPHGGTMIATGVVAPFFAPFKFAAVLALGISMPYLLYQAWAFIAPGLYRRERVFALPLLVSSILLFYLGCAFAYFVVFPLVFRFVIAAAPVGVAVMTDISAYLDFVLAMFFAFGLAFEVPVATVLLVGAGLASRQQLRRYRPYVIVGAFVFGMLLTPPDVISQVLLALPMWLLFEVGLVMSRFVEPRDDYGAGSGTSPG